MTDDLGQDQLIVSALERIPVPDYGPGFWGRLDERLAGEGPAGQRSDGGQPADGLAVGTARAPIVDLAPVSRIHRRRVDRFGRRRSLVVLVAAAAVIIAVVAVSLRPGRSDVQTAADISADGSTTATPSTVAHRGSAPSALVGPGTASTTASGPASSGGSPSTSVALGTSSGTVQLSARVDPSTPEGTFTAWAKAIQTGDTPGAIALTGPRTARYDDALGVTEEQRVTGWASAWGGWADVTDPHIEVVELGEVAGARVVGIVLQRPVKGGPHPVQTEALPVVAGADGWRVEPDAFDPSADGRIEVVSPAPGQTGLSELPSDGVVKVAAGGDGDYVLSLDLTQGTRVAAADAVSGTITWDPPDDALPKGEHLLLVAHVSDATITVLVAPFTVPG